MKVLAIDTSNNVLGVALLNETTVIGEYITNLKKNHSVRAMSAIEQLLAECDTEVKELTKIIVATGPGSYTGVRIGVSIAKTLAWSLNIPIIGVSSLEVLAQNGRYFNGLICPVFDARRGLVYTGLYKQEKGIIVNKKEDQNILLADWLNELSQFNEQILFLGNDVVMHVELIKEILSDQAVIGTVSLHNPRPGELGIIGFQKTDSVVHELVPNYIRLAEAEAKWLEERK
ncbi:tRNA (adenosine(37)-N6)-threonylcarbamoyltransferase complex dimerization subunit type 1 TsaB [Metabacillus fastidiosus]|uniref:tRNA (adenosine(37)-N6)-threonylcarbamoyltransferase complex dimerization subunit type 1 TsaB n=1 Tax=Metabacillus fastidiosus TaxID=1458 RepID=UPI003D2C4036